MQPTEMKKGTFNLPVAGSFCICSCNDYNIPAFLLHAFLRFCLNLHFMKPVAFSDQTCDPVPYDTVSNLFTYRDSDSTVRCLVGGNVHH